MIFMAAWGDNFFNIALLQEAEEIANSAQTQDEKERLLAEHKETVKKLEDNMQVSNDVISIR